MKIQKHKKIYCDNNGIILLNGHKQKKYYDILIL